MMAHCEMSDVTRLRSEHRARFYRTESELAESVAVFFHQGLAAGNTIVSIATAEHHRAMEQALEKLGEDPAQLVGSGRWLQHDALETLETLKSHGTLDHALFERLIGEPLRDQLSSGPEISLYGEMVAVLWKLGDVGAALELERYWNELQTEMDFSLYCSYPSSSLGPELRDVVAELETLHTHVEDNDQPAANVVIRQRLKHSADAPRQARHLAVETLRGWGDESLIDDTALIVTELATNAVIHAGTAFELILTRSASMVRVAVRDGSPVIPVLTSEKAVGAHGRGLKLISMLSDRWGSQESGEGKLVWAELHARGSGSR